MAIASYTKTKLSGSTSGRGIKVTGTSSGAAVTIHTAVSGTTNWDEIWIWCVNTGSASVKLTIMWGGTSDPDDYIEYVVTGEDGLKCIIPGLILNNSCVVKAFADSANVLIIHGFVNQITIS